MRTLEDSFFSYTVLTCASGARNMNLLLAFLTSSLSSTFPSSMYSLSFNFFFPIIGPFYHIFIISFSPISMHSLIFHCIFPFLLFFFRCGLFDFSSQTITISSSNSRKDLSLKDCKIDILLITGMLSPYSTVVEKLHRDVNKERVTILKVERAGDVLVDAVS